MFERLKSMLIKEFRQIFRNPRMIGIILIVPIFEVLVFGYAATTDVKNIPTAIYDLDNTPESRDVIRAFTYSKYFTAKYFINNDQRERELIDKAEATAVIRINRGFGADLKGSRSASLQIIIDGTDSNTAAVVLSYASRIIENYSYKSLDNRARVYLQKKEKFPSVDLRTRAWFNENLESRNFYIPGVLALIVTVTSLILSSMAMVREKENGTIEQLIVSPLRPFEIIFGKLLPFAVIALIDVILITLVGVFWFHLPIRGSLLLLFVCTLIYLLTTLGVGLFISTISFTQQEAMMSTFLFFTPANLLSGFIFPIANMPQLIQYVTYINPLRYYMVILRGIFLKGVGFGVLWPSMLILFVIGAAILALSSLRFQRRLG
ncbi:MAG: ABC transporter permease [Candidatus Omnitrophica bacterium]|nr:ABC transporter permease [Candidatus Omnitrophota bacterium]MDD5654903.1 ABC transporter permease [Candidatus Omnitrophota bacterium]